LGEATRTALEIGVWFGFAMWFVFELVFEGSSPIWPYVAGGACYGMALAATSAPRSLRVVVDRPSSDPTGLVAHLQRMLRADGYEPIEIAEKYCKLDRELNARGIALGPVNVARMTSYVLLAIGESTVTIARPCDVVAALATIPEYSRMGS